MNPDKITSYFDLLDKLRNRKNMLSQFGEKTLNTEKMMEIVEIQLMLEISKKEGEEGESDV